MIDICKHQKADVLHSLLNNGDLLLCRNVT